MPTIQHLFSLIFGLSAPVSRKAYAITGFSLMPLKLGVDAVLVHAATGRLLAPGEFLSLARMSDRVPWFMVQIMIVWALPFAWIGLSMSVRRAVDAGYSPWAGLLFCVPILNFFVMLFLCLPPTSARVAAASGPAARDPHAAARAIGASLLLAVVMAFVAIMGLESYGLYLFAGTPLAMGVLAGFLFNRTGTRTLGSTIVLAVGTQLTAGAVVVLFAVEGVICVGMALPMAIPLAILGSGLGRCAAVMSPASASPFLMILLVLPQIGWFETKVKSGGAHEVTTRVFIEASPSEVWRHVISFNPIPAPSDLFFRSGVAYPLRARIEGTGAGATRYCEFSTGAFVEPITRWDEPRELSFDVIRQPEPLAELTPYPGVLADHLDGSLVSTRGRFRLIPAGGGTILEGTTWYELSIFPESYWSLWTDAMIGKIHKRVLRHIKSSAESGLPLPER